MRVFRITFIISQFLMCLTIFNSLAYGDIMKEASVSQLTHSSETILIGTIQSVSSMYEVDSSTIYTQATISPKQYFLGDSLDKNLLIEMEGGLVGNILLYVASSPVFQVGDSIMVFLWHNGFTHNNTFSVVAGVQGKFNIYFDEETGRYKVSRDLNQIKLISSGEVSTPEFLDELIEEVRNSLP